MGLNNYKRISRKNSKAIIAEQKKFFSKKVRAFSFAVSAFLLILAIFGHNRMMVLLSSALTDESEEKLQISAYIVPPEYTGESSIVLKTGVGLFSETKEFPEGSILKLEISGANKPLTLIMNGGKEIEISADEKDESYIESEPIHSGKAIIIKQGWRTIAYWPVRVIRDMAPTIKFLERPFTVGGVMTRFSYETSDDYGVTSVKAIINPIASPLPAIRHDPFVLVLSSPGFKHSRGVDMQDLTFLPWAGSTVEVQLEAADAAGNKSLSEKVKVALPKRTFSHPFAKALIEQREKLIRQPSAKNRDETANLMAGIARESIGLGGDKVIFMALRTGAVRLVLDENENAINDVSRLIWQAAARIEDTMSADNLSPFLQASKDKG